MKHLFVNCNILTLEAVSKKAGKHLTEDDLSFIEDGAFVVDRKKIEWIGKKEEIPARFKKLSKTNLKGKCVLPAFVECHTHTVFAGSRAEEFELRQKGLSYQQIAERGGGILSTVSATRKASELDLKKMAQRSVDDFVRQGVTTLEIKSGYGLNLKEEEKILRVAKSLKGPRILTTYLGPHAKSPDYETTDAYLETIIKRDLASIKKHKLAERVDMFVENGYYSIEQAKAYYEKAKSLGFDIVVHADQLTRTGASVLASEMAALSCDHAIELDSDDIRALAKSETTAVLLPTADQYIRSPYPRSREMLDCGVRIALATDYNPGTSPTRDLSFVGVLARVEMKMLLHEVIAAYTYNAACALGLQDQLGSLEVGKLADFIVVEDYHDLFYQVGHSPVEQAYREGKRLL